MSGSNPDQLWNLVPPGPLPMTGAEQFLAATSGSSTAPLARYSTFNLNNITVFSVNTYGAKGDRQSYSGTLTVAAGSNPTLTIAGADLSAVVPGQLVILPLGGAAGAGVKATVGSVNVGASQITLSGAVSSSLSAIAFQATGNPTIGAAGTGVAPLDVYTLVGGTFVAAAQVTVQTTKVITVAINTTGSGGVDGVYTFIGTSGAATQFRFTGTITGGALASVVATPTTAGIYQSNPSNLMAEPIVDLNGVSGLVGATVTITMGANSAQIQSQPGSIAVVTVPGGYSAIPSNPVSTTGPGAGVAFNVAWTAPTVVIGTDNAPFINAASDAIRAQGTPDAAGRTAVYAKLVFSSIGDYLVNDSLNFTGLARLEIDGQRAHLYSCANGLPVFDELGAANLANTNLTITGDPTFPPRWTYQIGRISNLQTAPALTFDQLVIEGTFTDAGVAYSFCSEALNMGLIRGGFSAPYGWIDDACNSSFWNVTSKYITNNATPDHTLPFQGGNPGQLSLVNHHPNGCGVWMLGGADHDYSNSYFFCQQDVFVIIVSSLTAVATGLQASMCHVEMARHLVSFRKGPTSGYGTPQFSRFVFSDASCFVSEYLFDTTQPGIVSVRLFNTLINVAFGSTTTGYFDDPSVAVFSGIVFGAEGAKLRWSNNAPADMTGLVVITGADGPELFTYNLVTQSDLTVDGDLSVSGTIQSVSSISASDGTVASVAVSTFGFYTNPDFPTVTIDASAGVTATAVVTAMQWLSDQHIIAAGTGYAVGDPFTLVGGVHSLVAKGKVASVNGSGGVTSFTGFVPGSYSAYPPVGATTTTTTGGGTGLVISPLSWGVRKDGTGVAITLAGSGYTSFPGVTFSAPLNGASAARGSAVMGVAASVDSHGLHSFAGIEATNRPVTNTTYSQTEADFSLVLAPTGDLTLTLLAASSYFGRILNLKLTAAHAVASATANVVPLAGGAAGTGILAATAGKFCTLQSNGTAWEIMAAN